VGADLLAQLDGVAGRDGALQILIFVLYFWIWEAGTKFLHA
jgi:hypothetical protein